MITRPFDKVFPRSRAPTLVDDEMDCWQEVSVPATSSGLGTPLCAGCQSGFILPAQADSWTPGVCRLVQR